MGIAYSDGKSIEQTIVSLLENASELSSSHSIAPERFDAWPVRYHLSPERANLVRHLNFKNLDVLELGAGMGAVSRFIAEEAKSLTVVEGTETRFQALSQRLRDLKNWTGVVANISEVELPQKFDVVCVIGVLEYSELYVTPLPGETPFDAFLRKAKSFLKPDGVLVLAIENRLGLKYWNGTPEDHTNKLFDGICGYSPKPTPRTFSRRELKSLFAHAGFTEVEEYFPFPDYKIPSAVLSLKLLETEPALATDLANHKAFEGYDGPRTPLFSDYLATLGVANAGILSEFSNSFLFVSSLDKNSTTLKTVLPSEKTLAWHYSTNRKTLTKTVFESTFQGSINVSKEILGNKAEVPSPFSWAATPAGPLEVGLRIREEVLRTAYYLENKEWFTPIQRFIHWSFLRWQLEDSTKMSGQALDAIYTNAVVKSPEQYALFDLEWASQEAIPKSWFILRNILALVKDRKHLPQTNTVHTLKDLYLTLCQSLSVTPQLETDLKLEANLQSIVTPLPTATHLKALQNVLESTIGKEAYFRKPSREAKLRKLILLAVNQKALLQSAKQVFSLVRNKGKATLSQS